MRSFNCYYRTALTSWQHIWVQGVHEPCDVSIRRHTELQCGHHLGQQQLRRMEEAGTNPRSGGYVGAGIGGSFARSGVVYETAPNEGSGGSLSTQQVEQYDEERGDIAYQLGLVYHQTRITALP